MAQHAQDRRHAAGFGRCGAGIRHADHRAAGRPFHQNEPTIVNALFGLALLGGLVFRKPLLPYALGDVFVLTERGWHEPTIRWGVFFLAMAVLNEIVWRTISTDTWVAFKTFGYLPLTLVFAMAQVPLMTRHNIETAEEKGG